jgi:hypothetical protein
MASEEEEKKGNIWRWLANNVPVVAHAGNLINRGANIIAPKSGFAQWTEREFGQPGALLNPFTGGVVEHGIDAVTDQGISALNKTRGVDPALNPEAHSFVQEGIDYLSDTVTGGATGDSGMDLNSLLESIGDSAMGGYKPLSGPEDVSNVNPYTQDVMSYLFGGGGQGGILQTLIGQSQGGANLPTAPQLNAPAQMGALTSYAQVPGTPQQPGSPAYETFGQPAALTRLMGTGAGPQTSTVSAPTQGQQPTYGTTQQPQMPGAPDISSMVPGSPNINTNVAPGDFNAYNAVQMPNAPTPTDPNAAFNQFIGYAPQLQGLAQGSTSQFAQEQLGLADMMADDAVQDVLNQYSGQGAYYSGPAMQAAVEAAARPRQEAIAAITGQQAQTAGQLMGQGLQQMPGAYQAAGQQEIDLYNIGTNAALGLGTQGLTARGQNLDYAGLQQAAAEGNRDAQLQLYQLQQQGGLQQAGLAGDIYRSQLQYGADVYGTTANQQNVLNQLGSGDYQAGLNYDANIYGTDVAQQNVLNRIAGDTYNNQLATAMDIYSQGSRNRNLLNELASRDYGNELSYTGDIYSTGVQGALGTQANAIDRYLANTGAQDAYQRNLLNRYGTEMQGALGNAQVNNALTTALLNTVGNYGQPEFYEPNFAYQPGWGEIAAGLIGSALPGLGKVL